MWEVDARSVIIFYFGAKGERESERGLRVSCAPGNAIIYLFEEEEEEGEGGQFAKVGVDVPLKREERRASMRVFPPHLSRPIGVFGGRINHPMQKKN